MEAKQVIGPVEWRGFVASKPQFPESAYDEYRRVVGDATFVFVRLSMKPREGAIVVGYGYYAFVDVDTCKVMAVYRSR